MAGGKDAIGAELVAFFERYRDAGFPPQVDLNNFDLSPEAIALLKSGNTAMIEKYVGLQTPMIFWPPGKG